MEALLQGFEPELLAGLAGLALIVAAGAGLQSAAGFGFGMFAIPLIMLLGRPSYEAIAIVAVCSFVQTAWGSWIYRREVHWPTALLIALGTVIVMPAGAWMLSELEGIDRTLVRQAFGGLILGALLLQILWRPESRDRLAWGWAALASVVSGLMSGLAGMGGPPIVLWVMAHRWSNERTRATVWAIFTVQTIPQLLILRHRFGPDVIEAAGTGVLVAPALVAGILPGLWIGRRIPKPMLRRLSYVILAVIAASAIASPWW